MPSGEQSEERVTLYRNLARGWLSWTTAPADYIKDLPDTEIREFVSPSPVDTDSCPTCGNTEPRYFNEQFCPDPWHSRSQAGEG